MSRDRRRSMVYNALVLLALAASLSFITRLWPLLLLLLLGLVLCGIRLLVLSSVKVEPTVTQPLPPPREPKPETEGDLVRYAYRVLQIRISRELTAQFPAARWVWATPDAARRFADGEELPILLNGAGGYRQATVRVQDLRFAGLIWGTAPFAAPPVYEPILDPQPAREQDEEDIPETPPVNYEMLALEWAEAHLLELNQQANEAIAQRRATLLIPREQLPPGESWLAVCGELERCGFAQACCLAEGIEVTIPQ